MKVAIKIVGFLLLDLVMFAIAASAQTPPTQQPFYASGNEFLRVCDPDGAFAMSLPPKMRSDFDLACIMYVVGVEQGVQVEDNIRPIHALAPAEEKADKVAAKALSESGVKPKFSTPNANLCLPEETTNRQYLLVVVSFMKNHPETLDMHASYLVMAAMKNAWACSEKKGGR